MRNFCARVKRIGTTPGGYPLHANLLKTSYCEALATAARSWPSVFIYPLNQGADLMEHRPYPPDATNPPQSKFPWPLIAVIVAAVLLGVIVAGIPNTNKAAVGKMDNPDLATSQLRLAE